MKADGVDEKLAKVYQKYAERYAASPEAERGSWKDLLDGHAKTKKTGQRGSDVPSHLACLAYVKRLEAEMEAVKKHLDDAWIWLDDSKNFRRSMRHLDHAQQRMHRVVKKISRRKRFALAPRRKSAV